MLFNLPGRRTVDGNAPVPDFWQMSPIIPAMNHSNPVFMGEPLNFERAPVGGVNSYAGLSISPSVPLGSFCTVTLSSSGCW